MYIFEHPKHPNARTPERSILSPRSRESRKSWGVPRGITIIRAGGKAGEFKKV